MKQFTLPGIVSIAAIFSSLIFPHSAWASAEQGNDITLPQLLVGALVMGWYLFKHFKGSLGSHSKNLFSKGKKEEKAED